MIEEAGTTIPGQTRLLYEQGGLPIFQNRMYDTAEEAAASPRGDMLLVEDLRIGVVRNAVFKPKLMTHDAHDHNAGLSSEARTGASLSRSAILARAGDHPGRRVEGRELFSPSNSSGTTRERGH